MHYASIQLHKTGFTKSGLWVRILWNTDSHSNCKSFNPTNVDADPTKVDWGRVHKRWTCQNPTIPDCASRNHRNWTQGPLKLENFSHSVITHHHQFGWDLARYIRTKIR